MASYRVGLGGEGRRPLEGGQGGLGGRPAAVDEPVDDDEAGHGHDHVDAAGRCGQVEHGGGVVRLGSDPGGRCGQCRHRQHGGDATRAPGAASSGPLGWFGPSRSWASPGRPNASRERNHHWGRRANERGRASGSSGPGQA